GKGLLRPLGVSFGIVLALFILGCQRIEPTSRNAGSNSSGPADTPKAPPWFVDITDESGLNFVHDAGPLGHFFMPESIGSGVALFDFDNDGRLDLYFLQNGGPKSQS